MNTQTLFLGSVNVQRLVEQDATCVALEMLLFVSHLMFALRKLSVGPMAESWPCGPCLPSRPAFQELTSV